MSSNRSHNETPEIATARAALRRLTVEIDALDGRAAQYLAVHRTDLHCLDLLASRGPLTPSELAHATSLTSGGMSIALDRLERAGLARRVRHPGDGRSVLVEATDLALQRGREFFGPLATTERQLLARYAPSELRAIHGFLDDLAAAIAEHRPDTAAVEQPPSSVDPNHGSGFAREAERPASTTQIGSRSS